MSAAGPETRLIPTDPPSAIRRIDITGLVCPMTYVRTKLELESIGAGERLAVRIRRGESYNNVTRSVRDEGNAIVAERPDGDGIVELTIEKQTD